MNARGYSLEFHDYRRYQPGDDPRAIDWAVHARLGQLVVRLYRAEGHVPLHLLVDTSRSMALGTPPKLRTAARAAAALAYVAARHRDPLALATFDTGVRVRVPPGAGRAQLLRALEALARLQAAGATDFDTPLADYGGAVSGPGLAIVISDLLGSPRTASAGAWSADGLRYLLHRGLAVALVHVLDREELEPRGSEVVELIDVEERANSLVVEPADLTAYRHRVATFVQDVRNFCAASGIAYVPLLGDTRMDAIVGGCMRAGLLNLYA